MKDSPIFVKTGNPTQSALHTVDAPLKGKVSTNKLTCLIQLSDESEFEGGDLHFAFVNDGEFFKTPYKKGYVLIFPSIISHMVTELTTGERYIMREIISGEPFR